MLCFLPHKYAIYEYPQPFAPTPLDQPTKITCISWDPARNAVAIYSNPIFTAYYVYEPFNNGILPIFPSWDGVLSSAGTMSASIFFIDDDNDDGIRLGFQPRVMHSIRRVANYLT